VVAVSALDELGVVHNARHMTDCREDHDPAVSACPPYHLRFPVARCVCGHDEMCHDVMCMAPADEPCAATTCPYPDVCHCDLFEQVVGTVLA